MASARAVLIALVLGVAGASAQAAERPATVPALREWRPAPGTFLLRADPRIVVRSRRRRALRHEARTLARDLGRLMGRRVTVDAHARPGDVVLGLTTSARRLGPEGYRLRVGRAIRIVGRTAAGVFYGGRTLLQLVRGRRPIPRGRARDWPRYPERGMMIDNGRAFFSAAWLERRIRELADLKLNLLHLHFSDNQGFRLQSDSHPEIVTPPFLTKAELAHLVAVARRRHVTLVPELDAPGHMQAALASHPELQLRNAAGQRQPDKLDVTLGGARAFVSDLLAEYLPLFPGRYWHTGADEYLGVFSTPADYERYPQLQAYARRKHGPQANGKDAVLDFVDFVGRRVRAHGKELRVWSDGAGDGGVLRLDPRTTVMWWEERHSPRPEQLVAAGHRVLNAGWWPLYYVTGGPLRDLRTPVEQMYERWSPWTFDGPYTGRWTDPSVPPSAALSPDERMQLGASLQVWNDDPSAPGAREDAVAAGIAPRLRVLAQKTWDSPPLTSSYEEFRRLTDEPAGAAG